MSGSSALKEVHVSRCGDDTQAVYPSTIKRTLFLFLFFPEKKKRRKSDRLFKLLKRALRLLVLRDK